MVHQPHSAPGPAPAKGRLRLKITRGTASVQLRNALRERIIGLELEPGQYLSRAEIAEEYGVSQTPVRDALIKLEEEGLIATYPQSKTEVSRIDVEHALETHFLRLSLELEITRRLARAPSPAAVAKARAIVAMQEAARAAGDLEAFARLDREFHLTLYRAVGMERLYDDIAARSGHIDRLRNLTLPDPGKSNAIVASHGRILDAIEAADADAAEAAVREHLSGTLAKVDDIRARRPEYF